jgi:hypothetical protein
MHFTYALHKGNALLLYGSYRVQQNANLSSHCEELETKQSFDIS